MPRTNGDEIRRRRKRLRLTQQKLADKASVSRSTIQRAERSKSISDGDLQSIADAIGCSPDELTSRQPRNTEQRRRTSRERNPDDVRADGQHVVGRQNELRELSEHFSLVADETGLLVSVIGPPGIGKTTLVKEFLRHIDAGKHSCIVAFGKCSEQLAGTEAYSPFFEALKSLLEHGDREIREAVEPIMKEAAPTWYAEIGADPVEDPAEGKPAKERQRMIKGQMGKFLKEASQHVGPIVLFLDDLHWADASTIDLLSYLADRFEGMRVMILVTCRPVELTETKPKHAFLKVRPHLRSRGVYHEISIGLLDSEFVAKYLSLRFRNHHFPPEFSTFIYEKSGGEPFSMVELVNLLHDRGIIKDEGDGAVLTKEVSEIENELPQTDSVIDLRIDQLSDDDRYLLKVASVQVITHGLEASRKGRSGAPIRATRVWKVCSPFRRAVAMIVCKAA